MSTCWFAVVVSVCVSAAGHVVQANFRETGRWVAAEATAKPHPHGKQGEDDATYDELPRIMRVDDARNGMRLDLSLVLPRPLRTCSPIEYHFQLQGRDGSNLGDVWCSFSTSLAPSILSLDPSMPTAYELRVRDQSGTTPRRYPLRQIAGSLIRLTDQLPAGDQQQRSHSSTTASSKAAKVNPTEVGVTARGSWLSDYWLLWLVLFVLLAGFSCYRLEKGFRERGRKASLEARKLPYPDAPDDSMPGPNVQDRWDTVYESRGLRDVRHRIEQSTQALAEMRDTLESRTEELERKLAGYVSTYEFLLQRKQTASTTAELENRLRGVEDRFAHEVSQLQHGLSELRNRFSELQQEKMAERVATLAHAQKKLDELAARITGGIPRELADLARALEAASQSDGLPQLRNTGKRLLSELSDGEAGPALREYVATTNQFRGLRGQLGELRNATAASLDESIQRILADADRVTQSRPAVWVTAAIDDKLIQSLRQKLIKEIGISYVSIVMGKYQGDIEAAYEELKQILKHLGLAPIEITPGTTRPNAQYHEVKDYAQSTKHSPGSITNVLSMGYVEAQTGAVLAKAQVMVAE